MPHDPALYAVPLYFLALWYEARVLPKMAERGAEVVGFERRDTLASLAMGLGSLLFVGAINLGVYATAEWLWRYRLADLGAGAAAWVGAVVAWDLAYYWQHRAEHEVRLLWACHVNHHSSQRFNFSTALRQPWTPWTHLVFYPPLALVGFRPELILAAAGIDLIYQFWVHTETVDRLPRPIEAVFNTPSHHRVHHGSNPQYLDRNYGGILIVWDRLFGSFEPEGARVVYGLTKNIDSFSPVWIAFHEYVALARDVHRAPRWSDKVGHLVHGPAWQPAS